jgi:serine/threonine protein kinase
MIAPLQHRIGDLIQERYQVQRVLGAGAFGTVYLCRDGELGVPVAVKELHVLDEPDSNSDERDKALRQFRLEATHLSNLRHPHIVSGHYQPHSGAWEICPICGLHAPEKRCANHHAPLIPLTQRHYLVMEYVDGPHLGEAVKLSGGALPVERALLYIKQICGALKLIHQRGWIHRDIKPENVRIRSQGDEAVLLDFGIAGESGLMESYSTRPQRHTQGGGTMGYAPDNPQEWRVPDARSDIHALGMTLLHTLTGRDPTEPEDLAALRGHRASFFNRAVPPELDALILRAIHPDAARRPADGAEFWEELENLTREKSAKTPIHAPTPQSAPPATPQKTTYLAFRNGVRADSMDEFVRLADKFPHEAREMLFAGILADWLERRGWIDYAAQARRVKNEYAGRPAQGLEALLQSTGFAPAPRLQVEPRELDFGVISPGQSSTIHVRVKNPGRGHLFGVLRASHLALEFPSEFDGNDAQLPITFKARHDLRLRGEQESDLILDTSAGELRMPFRCRVRVKRSLAPLGTVLLWGVVGMGSGQFLRSWPMTVRGGQGGWGWLNARDGLSWLPAAPAFGFGVWLFLLTIILAEAQRRRSCRQVFWGGALAFLGGIAAMVWGNVLLTNGDELLQPLFSPLVRQYAAGGWLFAGAILGAAYGTFRRHRDLIGPRLLQICAGWLGVLFIAYSVLAAAIAAH